MYTLGSMPELDIAVAIILGVIGILIIFVLMLISTVKRKEPIMKELRQLSLEELFTLRYLVIAEINELAVKKDSELAQLDAIDAEIERKQNEDLIRVNKGLI